jgi:hypothetical protein
VSLTIRILWQKNLSFIFQAGCVYAVMHAEMHSRISGGTHYIYIYIYIILLFSVKFLLLLINYSFFLLLLLLSLFIYFFSRELDS